MTKKDISEVSAGLEVRAMHDFYKSNGQSWHMDKFDDGLTRQEFAEECDINTIMRRYEQQGVITHVNRANPMYVDWSAMPDLRGRLDAFRLAGEAFMSLPAAIRREFDNDPVKFVEFAQNSENLDKMREFGLAPPAPVEPVPVKVVVDNLKDLGVGPKEGGGKPA